ncbi:MAG: sigma factor [Dysgonamonadaceae bacterium]
MPLLRYITNIIPICIRWALRYLKNVEAAAEAVQHVFVKLWESVRHIEIEINLKNYLYTMTKNYI